MDPAPISATQTRALVGVAARELTWILPGVRRQLRAWRQEAATIPDPRLRHDALTSLARERLNAEGAALLAVIPKRRNEHLLRLLVAYQVILDYLDTVSEHPTADPARNGRHLHFALVEALDAELPMADHYRYHPWQDDGGYLRSLIEACRAAATELPGYAAVKGIVTEHARRLVVQVFNHDPRPRRRAAALQAWATREFPGGGGLTWFEMAAACSSTLATLALLALAADGSLSTSLVRAVDDAYFPWINGACTMLDSFVDRADDAASGRHSYVAHYTSPDFAVDRIEHLVSEGITRARRLDRGERHVLIASGMVAMYMSHAAARDRALRPAARRFIRSAGPLQHVQLPIMRIMRATHGLRNA